MLWLHWEVTAVKCHLAALKPGLAAFDFVHLHTIISPSTSIKFLSSRCFAVHSWLPSSCHATVAITCCLYCWRTLRLPENPTVAVKICDSDAGGQTCLHHKVTVSRRHHVEIPTGVLIWTKHPHVILELHISTSLFISQTKLSNAKILNNPGYLEGEQPDFWFLGLKAEGATWMTGDIL